MKQCPQCQFDDLLDTAAFCSRCGADLDRPAESHSRGFEDDDDTDDSRLAEPLAGSAATSEPPPRHSTFKSEVRSLNDEDLASTAEPLRASVYGSIPADEEAFDTPVAAPREPEPADPNQIRKLSSKEIKEISESMYGANQVRPYLSDDEKRNLLRSMDKSEPAADKPAPGPSPLPQRAKSTVKEYTDPHRPKMSDRQRGVSYYIGSIIFLTGTQRLHENDELTVSDRTYVLRKRRFSTKTKLISIGSAAAVLLFFTFLAFFSGASNGVGTVIGIVLDETQQPFERGADVRFPDLGKTIQSNGQGFFVADGIPKGSHKIEYVVGDQVVGTDYATVVGGEVTTVALRPTDLASGGDYASQTTDVPPSLVSPSPTDVAQPQFAEPTINRGSAPASYNSQLTLAANVDGATLHVDGKALGAGNLTYQKLKPGKHSYTVTADGYQAASGTVVLAAGEATRLEVALEPTPVQHQQTAEELAYSQGEAAMNSGDYAGAVSKFTEVLSLQPQSSRAFLARGEAYAKAGNTESATADFVQSGSLSLNEGNYNQAYLAYDRGCQMGHKSVPALLGRATANLVRGQDLAAIADYESVLTLDSRNVQAYMGIGEARYNLGNFKEAITNFKDARTLDPENTEIYENLMLSYLGDNDIKNVRKTFEKYKKMVDEAQLARMGRTEKYRLLMQVVSTGN